MKNLNKRKMLAAKLFGVGLGKITFDNNRLEEIKEAITKQDLRDLYEAGAISIKETKGKAVNVKRTTKRGPGKIKMKVHDRKGDYVRLTRKLRACGGFHTALLLNNNLLECFGDNTEGQCSGAEYQEAIQVACGGSHTALLTDKGKVLVWGDTSHKQCEVPLYLQ